MSTLHANLVQSFKNFKNKYITPLNNNKADKSSVPASITRSGTSFSAKNSDGTEIFNFDQQDTNTWRGIQNNLTSTSTTESLSAYQGYIMSRDIPWYGTSSTAASTIAKTATTSDGKFALVTGAKVSIKFTYNNTASAPTLNVDSTGAKSIKAYGTTAPTSWWQAGDVVTFTYDGTNWIMGATEGQIAQINSNLSATSIVKLASTNSAIGQTYSINVSDYDGFIATLICSTATFASVFASRAEMTSFSATHMAPIGKYSGVEYNADVQFSLNVANLEKITVSANNVICTVYGVKFKR